METENKIEKLYDDEEFVEFYDPQNYPWIPKGKYKVSNYGRVFSYNQECTYHQSKKGGYFIRIAGNGKNTSIMRAKMVLVAFKGVDPHKTKAHHLDGNVFNDKITNLEWATEKEISQFRMKNPEHYQRVSQMGKSNKGRKIVSKRNQKLTEEEVKWIKYAIKKGHSDDYILKSINYKIKSLNSIKYGYSWKKVE